MDFHNSFDMSKVPFVWQARLARLLSCLPPARLIILYGSRWAGMPEPTSAYVVLVVGDDPMDPRVVKDLRFQMRQIVPDLHWNWLSVRGGRLASFINPEIPWAIHTGYLIGDASVFDTVLPVPAFTLLSSTLDIPDDLEALHRGDDEVDAAGTDLDHTDDYRQLAKRLLILEQLAQGPCYAVKLACDVRRLMRSANVEVVLLQRAHRLADRLRHEPLNARDRAFQEFIAAGRTREIQSTADQIGESAARFALSHPPRDPDVQPQKGEH